MTKMGIDKIVDVGADMPEKNTDELHAATWICSVCGYQHVGPTPPKKCPQCGVDDIYFDKVE